MHKQYSVPTTRPNTHHLRSRAPRQPTKSGHAGDAGPTSKHRHAPHGLLHPGQATCPAMRTNVVYKP
jgi:hypothetical protein